MHVTTTGNIGIGTITPLGGLTVMNGNVGIGTWVPKAFCDIEGTLPSSASGPSIGSAIILNSNGSAAQSQTGLRINLYGGYTGSASTQGLSAQNLAAGTNTTFGIFGGNEGGFYEAAGTTTGYNYGVVGQANSGAINYGVFGQATTASFG